MGGGAWARRARLLVLKASAACTALPCSKSVRTAGESSFRHRSPSVSLTRWQAAQNDRRRTPWELADPSDALLIDVEPALVQRKLHELVSSDQIAGPDDQLQICVRGTHPETYIVGGIHPPCSHGQCGY